MITRPLDLASKLRPEPRNFDFLFLINGGLILIDGGKVGLPQLRDWLAKAAKTTQHPALLVMIDDETAYGEMVAVQSAANDAGFVRVTWSATEPAASDPRK
jgi:biopolymer transport protein ExbD